MTYNRRDLIGHWVKKQQPTQRMCGHACCRGKRVHPANYPEVMPSNLLRSASDRDLGDAFGQGTDERRMQIIHELERRDRAQAAKLERTKDKKARAFSRRVAHGEEIDRVFLAAESATNGNMLNAKGRAAGISDHYLLTAPEREVRRYASDELLNFFAEHHRPTAAAMRGQDTRLHAVYSAPRRKKYGVTLHRRAA
jgi:2-polyprenyl-6-methoxyphenol hydroxylase-like FAD-dependent oxidoreductase